MLQASSGRSGKQQQEQNSPNLAEDFWPSLFDLLFVSFEMFGGRKIPCRSGALSDDACGGDAEKQWIAKNRADEIR